MTNYIEQGTIETKDGTYVPVKEFLKMAGDAAHKIAQSYDAKNGPVTAGQIAGVVKQLQGDPQFARLGVGLDALVEAYGSFDASTVLGQKPYQSSSATKSIRSVTDGSAALTFNTQPPVTSGKIAGPVAVSLALPQQPKLAGPGFNS